MRRRLSAALAAAALAASLAAAAPARAQPAALVVRLEGAVRVQPAGATGPVAAELGMPLHAGARVIPGPGARAVLLHASGRTQVVAEPVTIEAAAQARQAGLFERSLRTMENVAAASARADPNRQGMIRPVPGAAVPLAPRNGIGLRETRPTFVWSAVPDAEGYVLQVRGEGGEPRRFTTGRDTTFALPAAAEPLVPGVAYAWTVAAKDGRVAPIQRFRIATNDEFAEVAEGLEALVALGLDPRGDGAFLAALLYREHGLWYEADRALDAVQRAGGDGRAFHLLRAEVYDAMGLLDLAAREFARADAAPGGA